ncbi:MAG TPA: sigma-70 family RNA polymerase sigma factor, partial [Actinomycetota bacterium]|nr:sigma-70 family RNA polymerase sigma factor [Actinomycetota bacterium]
MRAATAGDRGAFAAIYDRYADRLHDFCWSVLRDRDEAADATQDAFLVAAERLGQLRDPERLRPWLYAVARSQALRRVRARSRLAPEEDMTDLPDTATGPEQSAHQADLRDLVWNAAAGLSERDRALLDLHLRHGLEGADLGQAIGVEPAHAYVLLTRLRDQVERSLGALLVARLGRDDCPDLSRVLADWDGRFSPLIRKRVARHVDSCEVCAAARRKLASPLALLAAVPPMPAPAYLRGRVLERVQLTAGTGSGGGGSGGEGSEGGRSEGGGSGGEGSGAPQPQSPMAGPPEGESSRRSDSGVSDIHSPLLGAGAGTAGSGRGRRRMVVAGLIAAMLLAAGVGVGLGWERAPAASSPTDGQGGGPVVAGAATSVAPTSSPATTAPSTSTSTSTSVTTSTTTRAPVAPASLAVSPARVDLGAAGASATLVVRNGGDEALSWAADPSVPWLRVSLSAGRLGGGELVRVTLTATRDGLPEGDADGRVELTWDGPARAVAVALRVEHPPEVSGLEASPPQISVAPCAQATTTLVGATVTDESPLSSVTLRWGGQS